MAALVPMTPMRVPVSPSSDHPYRKKTPSPKSSSASNPGTPLRLFKIPKLDLSPPGLVKSGSAIIASRTVTTTASDVIHEVQPYPLEITLDFDLFQRGLAERMPTVDESMTIKALFPGCHSVDCSHPFLLLRFTQLPSKPWPLKIAGLNAWFIQSEPGPFALPLPLGMGKMGLGPDLTIDAEISRWTPPTTAALKAVVAVLETLSFSPRVVQWWGWYFIVELDDSSARSLQQKFPRKINGLVGYFRHDTPLRPQSALRLKDPAQGIFDNEVYGKTLRPGVMISRMKAGGDELLTTSGVCLESPAGERLVTCAAHGFLPGDGTVYHPTRQGEATGKVVGSIGTSDIAFMRLNATLKYAKETYSELDYDAQPFKGLGDIKKMKMGDFVYFNSPFNGLCMGTYAATDISRLPSDEPGIPHQWFSSDIGHFGQNWDEVLDGSCGAAVWNEEFEVLGQFRFMHKGGRFAFMPSYQELRQEGYKLVEI